MKAQYDRKEHAQGIVRYFEARIKNGDMYENGWAGLVAAQWFLYLANQEHPKLAEVDALLIHLENNKELGGSGWEDIRLGVSGLRHELENKVPKDATCSIPPPHSQPKHRSSNMNKFQLIKTQTDLDELVGTIDWEEAFIREMYVVSPSYIQEGVGWIAPGALPVIKMLIILPEPATGIELVFEETSHIEAYFEQEVRLSGRVNPANANVEIYLCDVSGQSKRVDIAARAMHYRLLNDDARGSQQRYGWQDVFNPDGSRANYKHWEK